MNRSPVLRVTAPTLGVAVSVLLVVAAIAIPAATAWYVYVAFPPLHAHWLPRFGPGTVPSLAVGILAIWFGPRLADRLPWRWMLLVGFGVGLAWLLALAAVDGPQGVGAVLELKSEYLGTARAVTDVGALLREYVSRIPLDSTDHWPVHVAGHPPGAVLFFVALVRLGLGDGLAAGLVVTVIAATTPVAVLITIKRLGAESEARRAAPFLVVGPAAIWMAVSADAMFGAVAAWGLCCLALAATSRALPAIAGWAIAAGALLGFAVMLSYGLVLLALLAVAVLAIARSWRALPWAVLAALGVVLTFAFTGFRWWEAYPVLVERYWGGIATDRPFGYWVWADLAALVLSAGPLVGASVAMLATRVRSAGEPASRARTVVILGLAAVATILVADLSGMSKAEVERIWLPFVPWLLLGTGFLPERWSRWALLAQVTTAVVIQHLLDTPW
jgi:hypothetical protein